jgi:hypothetical protein
MFKTFVRQKRASAFCHFPTFLKIFLFLFPQQLKCISPTPKNTIFRQKRASSRHRVEGRIGGLYRRAYCVVRTAKFGLMRWKWKRVGHGIFDFGF